MRGILINSYAYPTSGGGSPVYLLDERFEGTGYTNTWVESGAGTINEDYTTSPLEGSQSLQIAGAAQPPKTTWTFASDQSEIWVYFMLRVDSAIASGARTILSLFNSSSTLVGGVTMNATTNAVQANAGGNSTAAVTTPTTGTNYHFWYHWKKGAGSDAQASVGFATSATEPTSGNQFCSMSSGTAVTDVHSLSLGFQSNSTATLVFDKILVSNVATIGNSPA